MAEERQHHPELQLSILDLPTGRYHAREHDPADRGTKIRGVVCRRSPRALQRLDAPRDARAVRSPTTRRDPATRRACSPTSPDAARWRAKDGVRALLRLLQEPDRPPCSSGDRCRQDAHEPHGRVPSSRRAWARVRDLSDCAPRRVAERDGEGAPRSPRHDLGE